MIITYGTVFLLNKNIIYIICNKIISVIYKFILCINMYIYLSIYKIIMNIIMHNVINNAYSDQK